MGVGDDVSVEVEGEERVLERVPFGCFAGGEGLVEVGAGAAIGLGVPVGVVVGVMVGVEGVEMVRVMGEGESCVASFPRELIVLVDRDFVWRLERSGESAPCDWEDLRRGEVGEERERWALGELLELCSLAVVGGRVILVGVEVRGGEEGGLVRGEGRGAASGWLGGLEEEGIETARAVAMGCSVPPVFFLFFFEDSAVSVLPLFFRLK